MHLLDQTVRRQRNTSNAATRNIFMQIALLINNGETKYAVSSTGVTTVRKWLVRVNNFIIHLGMKDGSLA